MKVGRLTIVLAIYYLGVWAVTYVLLHSLPGVREYLPIGGVQELISDPAGAGKVLDAPRQMVTNPHISNFGESMAWLAVAIVGAIVSSLPVSWVYMSVRSGEEYDQSLVNTILVLPMVVTGIVIIVQNSLALAFSLAGIAGAVRFKNSLKSSGDALFILLSVGMGLAAGIGAVELAFILSLAFNAMFCILWATEYGEKQGMKRYLADYDGNDIAAPPPPPPPAKEA